MALKTTTITHQWAPGQAYKRVKISFVADDADATMTPAVLGNIHGYITRITVVPSPGDPVGPTNAAWDMTVVDENGVSILAGGTEFTNMSATVAAEWVPANQPFVFSGMTLTPTGNAVNSAEADVYVYIQK